MAPRLQWLLQHHHVSQSDLARRAGIAQPNLSAMLEGRRPLTPAMRERLLAALPRAREVLSERRSDILAALDAEGLTNPRLFGSVARGQDAPGSDLDILVSRRPGDALAAGRAALLAAELTAALGVAVDIMVDGPTLPASVRADLIPL